MTKQAQVFDLKNFWQFCRSLKIDTKELGQITLAPESLMGTQKYFIEEVAKGLNEGIHNFKVLKGRQLGITTICLALDLYWHFTHSGLSGSFVSHDEETRDMVKTTLAMYIDGLPREFKIPIESHNRTQLVFKNRSRLAYQVAGKRKNSNMGRGKGIVFLHATEVSSWGDEEGLASLNASLAEMNPSRLFVYETTARGYNMWFDMWETALEAKTQKAIFVGWWRNQFYRKKKGTTVHSVYWDGRLSPQEKKWIREIKQLYDFDIDDEQIAWWRWKLNEEINDETMMLQEFPPTEEYAFVLTGSQFFNSARINDEYKKCKAVPRHNYKFVLRENFEDTELVECSEKLSNLKIWEFPKNDAYYVIGADPAYGSSEWADRFCCSVYRAYADGLEQVAEFTTSDCSTYQFAWVICYLAGAYKNSMLNLEINGPGQAVWTEMQNLKRIASTIQSSVSKGVYDVVANIQNYLYKRPDSFGAPSAYHWKTTSDTKERMLAFFKDNFDRGIMTVRSKECLDEMKCVIRDEDGYLGAPGRGKDDRVIAGSLACIAWGDFVRMRLVSANITRAGSRQTDARQTVQENNVSNYLKNIGVTNAASRGR